MQRERLSLLVEVGKSLVLQFSLPLGLIQLVALGDHLGLVWFLHSLSLVIFLLPTMEVLKLFSLLAWLVEEKFSSSFLYLLVPDNNQLAYQVSVPFLVSLVTRL